MAEHMSRFVGKVVVITGGLEDDLGPTVVVTTRSPACSTVPATVRSGDEREPVSRHAVEHPQLHPVQRAGPHPDEDVIGPELGAVDRSPSIRTR